MQHVEAVAAAVASEGGNDGLHVKANAIAHFFFEFGEVTATQSSITSMSGVKRRCRSANPTQICRNEENFGICSASDILDIKVQQEKNSSPRIWYLVRWRDAGSSPEYWVCSEDMTGDHAQDLIRAFEQKHTDKVVRAHAEVKRRRGGRPPAPKASASTSSLGESAARPSTSGAPSHDLSTAVSSTVAGQMVEFLRRHPSLPIDDKQTWTKFHELVGSKRCRDCSVDTLSEHAQSGAFQKDLSHSKSNVALYEPENPKQKAYTR